MIAAGLVCWSIGCAARTSALNLHLGHTDIDLRVFLKEHPLDSGQNIRIDLIASGPSSSIHVVQIRQAEKPHLHARHHLKAVIIRGQGTMHIDGKKISAGVGSVFEIERGTPHYFVNSGTGTAAALVTFTPPYDGKDMIPVPVD